jgi:hypothetical protein
VECIAPTIDFASVEYARQSLADAIIAHACTLGTDDLVALKAAALASFSESGIEHACFAQSVEPQSVDASELQRSPPLSQGIARELRKQLSSSKRSKKGRRNARCGASG